MGLIKSSDSTLHKLSSDIVFRLITYIFASLEIQITYFS